MKIGAQLFTVRDYCENLEDFAETLRKIAEIGYEYVQVSVPCDYEPEWLDEQLKKNGLKCVITHFNTDKIKETPEEVAKFHQVFGCKHIGIGYMPGGLAKPEYYDDFVRDFKPAGKIIAENGGLMMYHNHNMEFMKAPDGKLYMEKLAEDFLPEELGFTLDTFWVQSGGGDPAQWLEKLSGRVPCIHLKDMEIVNREQRTAPLGAGNINFDRIFEVVEKAGVEYMFVEQDNCYDADPFDCLKQSFEYLKERGLV